MLHLLAVHTFSKDAILLVVVPGGMAFARRAKTLEMASRLTSTLSRRTHTRWWAAQLSSHFRISVNTSNSCVTRIRPFGCEPTEHLHYSNWTF